MTAQVTIELRITQQGNYGAALTLGDTHTVELAHLSDFAQVLVKIHEAIDALVKQHGVVR